MKSWRLILACVFLAPVGVAQAVDYEWVASTSGLWTTNSNWNPSTGNPSGGTDVAIFGASGSGSCTLLSPRSFGTLSFNSTYTGTLSVLGGGSITARTISFDGGTMVTSGASTVRATESLNLLGGTFTSMLLDGTAAPAALTIHGPYVGSVRLEGSTAVGVPGGGPVTGGALHLATGQCEIIDYLAAGSYTASPGTTTNISGGLAVGLHSLQGTIFLGTGGVLGFLDGANVTSGTIDCSQPSAVVCNGDWLCTAPFLTSGTVNSVLTIVQGTTGSTVNHGTNGAGLVVIQNGVGRTTTWNSTNSIVSLTVAADSTLSIAAGRVLTVPGAIANGGLIEELAPGRIHHAADALEPVDGALLDLLEVVAGSPFRVRLRDADEALSATAVDTAAGITVTNPRNGDTETFAATETGATSTIFVTGSIPTVSAVPASSGDGMLQVLGGDTLSITYVDSEDAADNAGAASLAVVGASGVGDWRVF